ncbi:MAG: hypothetical protein SGPRY_013757 [Prymnesium sp.]
MGALAANEAEYAEARMLLEAGVQWCGATSEAGQRLVSALGQMRRQGPSEEVQRATESIEWPGKHDFSPYEPSANSFQRFSTPAWPSDCPRGSWYPSGEGSVCVSHTPILPPAECAWVVKAVEQAAKEKWSVDHSNKANIGVDKIWDKPFPDRLWLREVPGLQDWFEHRLVTRLFPMLQSLYPEAIPHADCLRCHDAFISRYDAGGMASLEVHQDTTDFTFTIALNPLSEYEGGGTVFPTLRNAGELEAPYGEMVVRPDVGCVASFPGRLHHGGNEITSGYRYIIPLFIFLDINRLSAKPRGYLLERLGISPPVLKGIDAL